MWFVLSTVGFLLYIILNILLYTEYYCGTELSLGGFAQVLYTLQGSMSGTGNTVGSAIGGFFLRHGVLLAIGLGLYIWVVVFLVKFRKEKEPTQLFKKIRTAIVTILLALICLNVAAGFHLYDTLGIDDYVQAMNSDVDLYDEEYVDPKSVDIKFPEQKRNLIYILCESMERSYSDPEHGGGYKENLIPGLTALGIEGNDFSADSKQLNGGYVAGNTSWTIGGIVAQNMGIPLNIGSDDFNRNFEGDTSFLPYVTGLGDILKENGYNNYFMCGSDSAFGGRRNYFKQHGDYEIYDYFTAHAEKIIPENHLVWWGYEDDYLFKYAQKKLLEISKQPEPFNFTVLTVDTHFEDGYLCPDCEDKFGTQYENVIYCSDNKITEFVEWIKQQEFYKNTTVVIAGDHLSMDGQVKEQTPDGYDRRTYFTVLNGPEYDKKTSREFASIDIFPTLIESLGANIEGHRLGLGTSLYSDEPTLMEKLGPDRLSIQMSGKSDYYNSVLLKGDEAKVLPNEEKSGQDEKSDESSADTTVTITAQEYQEQMQNFQDPGYVWTPTSNDSVSNYIPQQPVDTTPVTPVIPDANIPITPDPGEVVPPNPDNPGDIVEKPDEPEGGNIGNNTGTNDPGTQPETPPDVPEQSNPEIGESGSNQNSKTGPSAE